MSLLSVEFNIFDILEQVAHQCDKCGKIYKTKDSLARHKRNECQSETYGAPEVHHCDICGRTYKYKDTLSRHKRYECGKEPQFQCQYCPYKAKQKSTLTSHMLCKHSDIKMGNL